MKLSKYIYDVYEDARFLLEGPSREFNAKLANEIWEWHRLAQDLEQAIADAEERADRNAAAVSAAEAERERLVERVMIAELMQTKYRLELEQLREELD